MSASLLPYIPEPWTNATWTEEPWQFYVAAPPEDTNADDFTGCTFSAGLRDPLTGATILQMTDGNGLLVVTLPNEVVPFVPKATMETLAQYVANGEWLLCDFDLSVTYPSGFDQPLLYGPVRLRLGVGA